MESGKTITVRILSILCYRHLPTINKQAHTWCYPYMSSMILRYNLLHPLHQTLRLIHDQLLPLAGIIQTAILGRILLVPIHMLRPKETIIIPCCSTLTLHGKYSILTVIKCTVPFKLRSYGQSIRRAKVRNWISLSSSRYSTLFFNLVCT